MHSCIQVKNFSKRFGKKAVISDLSFDVQTGEMFAFLGANGSGKTTTIRCLLGIYQADAGQLCINGYPYTTSQSNVLGYLPEERGLYLDSRVVEVMTYFGQLKGLTYNVSHKRATDYLERVGLVEKANTKIKLLSSGQQQKIQLGITIINQPQILILDEPTKGLDPVNRNLLLEILQELNKTGTTIMFSTHQMEEAEKFAQRLLLLKDGKAALYGELAQIKQEFSEQVIDIRYTGKIPTNPKLYELLSDADGQARIKPLADSQTVLSSLIAQNTTKLESFTYATPSLNDIFIQVTLQKRKDKQPNE